MDNRNSNVVSGVEPARKRKTGAVIGGVTAGVIAVSAGGGVLAYNTSDYVKNQVKLLTNSPDEYFAWVNEKTTDDFTATIVDAYRQTIENRRAGSKATVSLTYAPSNEAKSLITDDIDPEEATNEEEKLLDIVDFIKSVTVGVSADSLITACNGDLFLNINDKRISAIDFAADTETLDCFFRMEGLSDQWLYVDGHEYIDDDELEEYKKALKDPEEIMTPEELESIIKRYSTLYRMSLPEVSLEKKQMVDIGDISVEYTAVSYVIDSTSAKNMADAFVTEIKNDTLLREIMVDRSESMTAEEYDEAVAEMTDSIGDISVEKKGTMTTYIDPTGCIRGVEFTADGTQEKVKAIIGKSENEIRGEFILNAEEQTACAALSLTETEGAYNGTLKVISEDDTIDVEFKDIVVSDDNKGYTNGTIVVSAPDLLEQELTLNLGSNGTSQRFSTEIVYKDIDYGKVTLEYSMDTGAEVEVPDKKDAYDLIANQDVFPNGYISKDEVKRLAKENFMFFNMYEQDAEEYAEKLADELFDRKKDTSFGGFGMDDYQIEDIDEEAQKILENNPFDGDWEDDGDDYFDSMVTADTNEAAIFVIDKDFTAMYFGTAGGSLSYDAEVAEVTCDGEYSISVTADSYGREATMGELKANGLYMLGFGFESDKDLSDVTVEVKAVKIDGKEVTLTGEPTVNIEDDMLSVLLYVSEEAEEDADTEVKNFKGNVFAGEEIGEWTDLKIVFAVKGIK